MSDSESEVSVKETDPGVLTTIALLLLGPRLTLGVTGNSSAAEEAVEEGEVTTYSDRSIGLSAEMLGDCVELPGTRGESGTPEEAAEDDSKVSLSWKQDSRRSPIIFYFIKITHLLKCPRVSFQSSNTSLPLFLA